MQNNYKIIHPLVVFFAGWSLWGAMFWISPFQTDIDYYLQHPGFEFWRDCLVYFLAGIIIALFLINGNKNILFGTENYSSFARALLFILTVSLVVDVMQTIDFVYSAGGARNLTQAREDMRAGDSIYPGLVALTVWVLVKLSIFPVFIVLIIISKNYKINSIILYFSLLVAFYALGNLLIFGKRSFMIFTLGIYFSYFFYFRLWQVKGLVFKGIVLMLVLFIGSYITFNARYGGQEFALLGSIQAGYSYAGTVLPTAEVIEEIETNISKRNNFIANAQISAINFAQYYTHGTFEFFDLYDFIQGKDGTNGMITLSMPYKVLDLLGIINKDDYKVDMYTIDPKPWVFDSFLGGQLKDWGDNAIYSMFIIGFVFGLAYRAAQASLFLFPIYAILSNLVFFMPVTDMIYNAQGWHYITLSIVFYLYMRAKANSPKSKLGNKR